MPIHTLWWTIFGASINFGLTTIYHALASVPVFAWVGAYGLAVIALTIVIKLILSPLYQLQLLLGRRNLENQRKLAPQLADIRKTHKKDPQKQQAATMALYKEHGINPLGNLSGCLPSVVQLPILTALYYVYSGNSRANTFVDHFLFIPHLNVTPISHPLVQGIPIPAAAYLVIPILAGATTFVQSRMMQQPPNPSASDQERQAQSMTKQMQVFMPLMIFYFAIVTPAGLGLYWLISNCFAIGQQYLVNGWGGLLPASSPPASPAPGGASRKPPARAQQLHKPPAPKPAPRPTPRMSTDPKRPPRKTKR